MALLKDKKAAAYWKTDRKHTEQQKEPLTLTEEVNRGRICLWRNHTSWLNFGKHQCIKQTSATANFLVISQMACIPCQDCLISMTVYDARRNQYCYVSVIVVPHSLLSQVSQYQINRTGLPPQQLSKCLFILWISFGLVSIFPPQLFASLFYMEKLILFQHCLLCMKFCLLATLLTVVYNFCGILRKLEYWV